MEAKTRKRAKARGADVEVGRGDGTGDKYIRLQAPRSGGG
jgi:hypothetical protein